jgi:hypothetical protein
VSWEVISLQEHFRQREAYLQRCHWRIRRASHQVPNPTSAHGTFSGSGLLAYLLPTVPLFVMASAHVPSLEVALWYLRTCLTRRKPRSALSLSLSVRPQVTLTLCLGSDHSLPLLDSLSSLSLSLSTMARTRGRAQAEKRAANSESSPESDLAPAVAKKRLRTSKALNQYVLRVPDP